MTLKLDSVAEAIEDIAAGKAVVVIDDEDRENEGDLIFAGSKATSEMVAFMIRYTSGVICISMNGEDLDRLSIPPMTSFNEDKNRTAFTVSVDARRGIATGISAHDRARTIKVLSDSATDSHDITRPGHIFPLRAASGGVLQRAGHTEASYDLVRLANMGSAGVLCELVNEDGTMMRGKECRAFADEQNLKLISITDIITFRRKTESLIKKEVETMLQTDHGKFQVHAYTTTIDDNSHIALIHGDIGDGEDILVRVHSECLTGDTFSSLHCDCRAQLETALQKITEQGRGIVLYMRGHEGRGIGIVNKLKAYNLQHQGRDTVDANIDLGLPVDARDYGVGAQILSDLKVKSLHLLTNNPQKRVGLSGYDLKITKTIPISIEPNPYNKKYIETKKNRLGHVYEENNVS